MDIKTVRIKEFPQGAWLVRWLGKTSIPQHAKDMTPKIDIWIQRLDDVETAPSFKVLPKADSLMHITIGVGSIPCVAIGSIFMNGIMVDEIDSKLIDFTCNTQDREFRCCADDIIPGRPLWWNEAYPYKAIAKSEFPLGGHSKTPCSVFFDGENTIVMPEYEIFRAGYAASSSLAIALLSKPWNDDSMNEFIDLQNSIIDNSGRATTVLRGGVKGIFAPILFNLIQNHYGLCCAKSIYLGRKAGYISAPMPFETQHLKITAKAIKLNPCLNKYLVLRIVEISWPEEYKPNNWHVVHENLVPGTGETLPAGSKQDNKNIPPTNRPRKNINDCISIVEGEDPNRFGEKITITGPIVEWTNTPKPTKAYTENLDRQKRQHKNGRNRICSDVSTGKPKSGKSDAGRGEAETVDPSSVPLSSRLHQIKELMFELRKEKRIINISSVIPTNQLINRNSSVGWPLRVRYEELDVTGAKSTKPLKHTREDVFTNWSYIDKSIKLFRCAIIYKVKAIDSLKNPVDVFWIEIEPREKERRFCAFLAYFPGVESVSNNDMFEILKFIAAYKGNSVYIIAKLNWKMRCGRFFKWKHKIRKIDNTFNCTSARTAILHLIDNSISANF